MKEKYRKSGLLYLIAAACFLLVGIIGIFRDGVIPYSFIGLSCAFVCLGCVNLSKAKKCSDEDDDKKDD